MNNILDELDKMAATTVD